MSGPVVVVTGANRGIGREIARQLVERGARVVVTARDAAKAEHAATELGAAMGVALDVASKASAHSAAEAVRERFGRLDALVNNAGVMLDASDSPLETDEAIILRNCPFHRLAQEHTELVCGINLCFVEGVLDAVDDEGYAAHLRPRPDTCCVTLDRRA